MYSIESDVITFNKDSTAFITNRFPLKWGIYSVYQSKTGKIMADIEGVWLRIRYPIVSDIQGRPTPITQT